MAGHRYIVRFRRLVARFGVLATMAVMMEMAVLQAAMAAPVTAHDFTFESIDGGALPLSDFAGSTLLLVNTASMCGFTPQYEALQALYDKYRDRGLVVLGVPSDDFGGQEYGDAAKIKQFCEINYGITFPMTEAVRIKGADAHPYYQWVATQGRLKVPRWNFYKHVIDADGNLVEWFASTSAPDSRKVLQAIEAQLSR